MMEKSCPALKPPRTRHGEDVFRYGRQYHLLLVWRQLDNTKFRAWKGQINFAANAKIQVPKMRTLHRLGQAVRKGNQVVVGHA